MKIAEHVNFHKKAKENYMCDMCLFDCMCVHIIYDYL